MANIGSDSRNRAGLASANQPLASFPPKASEISTYDINQTGVDHTRRLSRCRQFLHTKLPHNYRTSSSAKNRSIQTVSGIPSPQKLREKPQCLFSAMKSRRTVLRDQQKEIRMNNGRTSPWHHTLKNFDDLPDSANVSIQIVCALFCCSTATVWRRVKQGTFVQPVKFGLRTTRWNVGQLRAALNAR